MTRTAKEILEMLRSYGVDLPPGHYVIHRVGGPNRDLATYSWSLAPAGPYREVAGGWLAAGKLVRQWRRGLPVSVTLRTGHSGEHQVHAAEAVYVEADKAIRLLNRTAEWPTMDELVRAAGDAVDRVHASLGRGIDAAEPAQLQEDQQQRDEVVAWAIARHTPGHSWTK